MLEPGMGYCPICREKVRYTLQEEVKESRFHRRYYEYLALVAYCPHCDKEIFVPSLDEINKRRLYALRHDKAIRPKKRTKRRGEAR